MTPKRSRRISTFLAIIGTLALLPVGIPPNGADYLFLAVIGVILLIIAVVLDVFCFCCYACGTHFRQASMTGVKFCPHCGKPIDLNRKP